MVNNGFSIAEKICTDKNMYVCNRATMYRWYSEGRRSVLPE